MDFVSNIRNPRGLGGLPAFSDLSTWAAWIVFSICARCSPNQASGVLSSVIAI